ncbi:substrate-binding periplasmic protein [Zooshikella harenae]|uniref:Amino acid ABC transporter substrate-binding protein n=1 Tax=Zooshikella harenae TaxID=2827238 RepID=A0ABS5ZFP2_9GAMM|nr:transporter substrate-binding domain-containing protein [Zooshikella harenae]MBU2712829.1 amino acid ABC transporter substrate-binding protein [Zooshikella harenae]
MITKLNSSLSISLFSIVFSFVILLSPAYCKELKFAATEWPPYSGANLKGNGFSPQLIKKIFSKNKDEVQILILPWARALKGTIEGDYDGLLDVWYSEERAQELNFSDPYMYNRIKFIKRTNSDITYNKFSDLKSYRIGIVRDYAYNKEFDASKEIAKISERTFAINFYKLLHHRIDLTLEDELVARHEIKKISPLLLKEVVFLPKVLSENKLHVAFSKENRALVEVFNSSLEKMQKDGSLLQLMLEHDFFIEPNPTL